jgi:hypothetical protein
MKLRTIAEIQYHSGPRTGHVGSAAGKYVKGAVNDLTGHAFDPKSDPPQEVKDETEDDINKDDNDLQDS